MTLSRQENRASLLVLRLISETPSNEMRGLELVKASGGLLKRGLIYILLQRMEEQGLLASREESPHEIRPEIGIARRFYKVTFDGNQALAQAQEKT